jgi:hypothetical protein
MKEVRRKIAWHVLPLSSSTVTAWGSMELDHNIHPVELDPDRPPWTAASGNQSSSLPKHASQRHRTGCRP